MFQASETFVDCRYLERPMSQQVVIGNLVEIKKAPLPIFHQGLDLWTCKVSGRKYLAIHGFYVDSKFVLRNVLLSGAQVERDFSVCGNLLVPNRSRIETYWVEMVMFLKANYEHIPEYGDIPMIFQRP